MRRPLGVSLVVLAALSAACASSHAVPRPFPMPGGTARAVTPAPGALPLNPAPTPAATEGSAAAPVESPAPPAPLAFARQLVDSALSFRGVKYRNGGADPK